MTDITAIVERHREPEDTYAPGCVIVEPDCITVEGWVSRGGTVVDLQTYALRWALERLRAALGDTEPAP